jgi:hypothetical protein
MPRAVALLPGAIAVADLGHFVYRLELAATMSRDVPSFSLVYRYPPNPVALMQPDGRVIPLGNFGMITLARAPAQIAATVEELQRVVEVSLDGGTRDKDIERMTEAYQLFRNSPKTRAEVLDLCVKDSAEIIKAYWSVREWIETGMKEATTLDVLNAKLVLQP